MNKFYTAQEVADRLKVKKTTVYELIKRGELPSTKIGKQLRIGEDQLAAYLEGGGAAPPKQRKMESSILKMDYLINSSGFILGGQSCPALDLLCDQLQQRETDFPILQSHMNTYNSLYALYFDKVHLAAVSGLTPEEIKVLVPGQSVSGFFLYDYREGLCLQKGNPKGIRGVKELTQLDVLLANREKGSSRRMMLDRLLKEEGLDSRLISGYRKEYVSDAAAIRAVSQRLADAAPVEEASVRLYPDLEFLPLADYSLYLLYPAALDSHPGIENLGRLLASQSYRESLAGQTGYLTRRTGERIAF